VLVLQVLGAYTISDRGTWVRARATVQEVRASLVDIGLSVQRAFTSVSKGLFGLLEEAGA